MGTLPPAQPQQPVKQSVAPPQKTNPQQITDRRPAAAGMSLKSVMSDINNQKKTSTATASATVADLPIDAAKLVELWKLYAANIETANPHLFIAMANMPTVENNEVHVHVANSFQASTINEDVALATFLRQNLGRTSLVIIPKVDVSVANAPKPAYTAKEKIEKMIEKNPAVQSLIDQFKLDFDG